MIGKEEVRWDFRNKEGSVKKKREEAKRHGNRKYKMRERQCHMIEYRFM